MEKMLSKTKLSDLTDEELMVLYQKNDQKSFNELFARYQGRVYGFVSKRVFDKNETKDILQNIFLKLHQSRNTYENKYPFSAWIFCLSKSVIIDYFRKKNSEQKKLITAEGANLDLVSSEIDHHFLEKSDLNLNLLPDGQRKVLEFRYQQEMTFEEIAHLINKKPENIRQIISRSLRIFKKQFEVKNAK
jgi:RNA polymerase sigma factor (sigma-70 family)